jgi:hypothetical protein
MGSPGAYMGKMIEEKTDNKPCQYVKLKISLVETQEKALVHRVLIAALSACFRVV